MFQNYFKTAWRNLQKNKGFAFTNLLSLTIGISSTLMILLWVQSELAWNRDQQNYETTYQVYANRDFNGNKVTENAIALPLADAIKQELPQVKYASFTSYNENHILTVGDKRLKKVGYRVSADFFRIFNHRFLQGSMQQALNSPDAIILSAATAMSLFGSTDVVNTVIRLNNQSDVKVSAVIADVSATSTLQFDFITPYNYRDQAMQDWTNSYSNLYLQTAGEVNEPILNKAINKLVNSRSNNKISTYFIHPMKKWRLYSEFKDGKNVGGMITYVRLFSIIAFVILLIACINFMNLSTARSEKRAREVGIRKTLGSGKKQLMLQFFCESVILAFAAFILSVVVVSLLLPAFNRLIDRELALQVYTARFWLLAVAIITFTGIVAGSYPAVYLSSFNPVKVLKGSFLPGKAAVAPRRMLVVAQFIISILLMSSTIIIYQQIRHVKHRDLGYNTDNLIVIPSSPDIRKNIDAVRNQLLATGYVSSITQTSSPITDVYNYTPAPDYPGKPTGDMIVSAMSTAQDFTKTMGIRIIQGSDFLGTPADSSSMLINEAAMKTMGLKDPVGTPMRYGKRNYVVKGVTANVVMVSPYQPVDPMIIFYRPNNAAFLSIRLRESTSPQIAMNAIRPVFASFNPAFPFEYEFVDAAFNRKFVTEELIGTLTNIFAGLAIFICCLGMAGLASFTIEKRFREISVRKILGASGRQLLMLIAREFLRLVAIAFIVAVPLCWWSMNSWLSNYEYRIQVQGWIFGLVGTLVMIITLIIVWINIARVVYSNPAVKLRE